MRVLVYVTWVGPRRMANLPLPPAQQRDVFAAVAQCMAAVGRTGVLVCDWEVPDAMRDRVTVVGGSSADSGVDTAARTGAGGGAGAGADASAGAAGSEMPPESSADAPQFIVIRPSAVRLRWLTQRAYVVVHLGGTCCSTTCLVDGVPQVVLPAYGHQFYWASRLRALKVALCCVRIYGANCLLTPCLAATGGAQCGRRVLSHAPGR